MNADIHEDLLFSGNGLNTIHKLIAYSGVSKRASKFWDIYRASDTNPGATSSSIRTTPKFSCGQWITDKSDASGKNIIDAPM